MELLSSAPPPLKAPRQTLFLERSEDQYISTSKPKRHRHRTFLLANQETKKVYSKEKIKTINHYAQEYQNDVKDKKIVLINEKEQKALVLDYFTRFSNKYLKRFYGKIYAFREDIANASIGLTTYTTLITLTIAPEHYFNLDYAYKNLRKEQHKLITALKREYGKNILGYLFIPELGKQNYRLHGHIIIIHTTKWISIETIRNNYRIGNVDIKRRFGNAKSGIAYLLKYVSKFWNKENELGSLTLATFWSLNARVYSHSRLSLVSLEAPRLIETGWVFMGSFDKAELSFEAGVYDLSLIYPKILELST